MGPSNQVQSKNWSSCLASTDSCPANWVRYGDFCFSYYSRRYTYGKAEAKCRETPGASVVTPQTPEQNKQLEEVVEYLR